MHMRIGILGGFFFIFLGFFLEDFFRRDFLEGILGRISLGGFFWENFSWEEFFVYIVKVSQVV